ncbi:MAG: 50S ribosomal protein L11 [Candidatus Hepatoplasma vulgare]|nr:MAG: 50S ribosomal protein L11 [Candidatus Hepatoplasma sp.]
MTFLLSNENYWSVSSMAKKITRIAKLQFLAGQAKPGPALAGLGIDMPKFTKAFNDATKDRNGDIVPVVITAYGDRSFDFVLKTTPVSAMIKKVLKIEKGAKNSKKEVVGTLSKIQLEEIAKHKLVDLNTDDIDMAISMVKGTCKNMGVKFEE